MTQLVNFLRRKQIISLATFKTSVNIKLLTVNKMNTKDMLVSYYG